ncbi:hypothetical protein [Acinetobacter entericus]|uniref:DUF4145 domain-containing protein n=1 Tax=Acinetobacter entericus TaxID=2989714 RepID=A0ABT3NEH5_9GAMM|nr:hypothetical protein [Acinetobacter entericus]MCW8037961.1 hypothetical protein [Acinetobacter entericus]
MNKYDSETIMQNFNKILQPFTDIARNAHKIAKNPKFQQTLQNISVAIQHHEKTAPQIDKMLSEMEENENLSEALEIIPYRQIFKLALDNFEVRDLTILKLVNQENFQNGLLKYFDEIEIDTMFKKRKVCLEEALKLYDLNYFAGCSCLLHSILEGIITDYLIFKNIIVKFNKNGKTVYKKDNQVITGLSKKIDLSKSINNNFLRLENYKFDSSHNKKFHNERNDVLHGSNIDNFTAERCFITIIWISSLLSSIQNEQQLDRIKIQQILKSTPV